MGNCRLQKSHASQNEFHSPLKSKSYTTLLQKKLHPPTSCFKVFEIFYITYICCTIKGKRQLTEIQTTLNHSTEKRVASNNNFGVQLLQLSCAASMESWLLALTFWCLLNISCTHASQGLGLHTRLKVMIMVFCSVSSEICWGNLVPTPLPRPPPSNGHSTTHILGQSHGIYPEVTLTKKLERREQDEDLIDAMCVTGSNVP